MNGEDYKLCVLQVEETIILKCNLKEKNVIMVLWVESF